MYPSKTPFIIVALACLAACGFLPELDDVLPDQRDVYRNSRSMPPLEVPPDLTSSAINNSMAIPGEQMPNTLSAYQRQQNADPALGVAMADEQMLLVQGDQQAVWLRLRSFWDEQGIALELDDVELGVMETAWTQPQAGTDGEVRARYRVFAEPGTAGTTALFISQERQRRASAADGWSSIDSDSAQRQQVVAALSSYFGASQQSLATNTAAGGAPAASTSTESGDSSVARAEIINNDQGQVYMSLPDDFEQAWKKIEPALIDAGLEVRSSEKTKGEYLVVDPTSVEEDEGWLSALAFWDSDEPALYHVSLSATDESTQLILRDDDGEWLSGDDARSLLYRIQQQYNR